MADGGFDHFRLDATGLDADEAFDRYRALYAGGAEVERLGERIGIDVSAWRLDRMALYERRLDNIEHRRTATRVETTGFSHFTATLLIDGSMEIDVEQRPPLALAPGEIAFLDMRRPAGNRFFGAHVATLSIARERLATMAGDVEALHGLILGADAAPLYREFVESLLRNLPSMPATAALASTGVLTALLTIALDRSATGPGAETEARDAERLSRFKRMIDQRLADPDFDVADAVRQSTLSRSALYRLLAPEGGLATLIRNRRLEALRLRLGDPGERRGIADLVDAVGLASASHASRVFAERYGLSPGQYRRIAAAGSGNDAFLKMRLWLDELR